MLRILLVILVGMPASLAVTASVAKAIRQLTNTELEPPEPQKPKEPFTRGHHIAWSESQPSFSVALGGNLLHHSFSGWLSKQN